MKRYVIKICCEEKWKTVIDALRENGFKFNDPRLECLYPSWRRLLFINGSGGLSSLTYGDTEPKNIDVFTEISCAYAIENTEHLDGADPALKTIKTTDIIKGEEVWAWDDEKEGAEKLVFLVTNDLICTSYPHLCILGETHFYHCKWFKNISRKKPIEIPPDGTPVLVDNDERRRYSAGKLDKDGFLACYRDGGDKWSSMGKTTYWPTWRLALTKPGVEPKA